MEQVLTTPHFVGTGFVASNFDSAEDKAKFANRLVRLIKGDFKPTLFTHALYHDLALSFGFIAHYDREGFYATQFGSLDSRINFLKTLYQGGVYVAGDGPRGDPHFTRSDVEHAFRHHPWIEAQFERLETLQSQSIEARDRADLRHLAAKYPDEIASL